MVSRKAHNLKTVVRFDLPQPHKEKEQLNVALFHSNARSTGLEPATSHVTGECSNQLSYDRILFIYFSNISF